MNAPTPQQPYPSLHLAKLYSVGKYAELIKCCEANFSYATQTQSDAKVYESALGNLFRAYYQNGDYESGENLMLDVLKVGDPTDPNALARHGTALDNLAHIYLAMRRYDEAESAIARCQQHQLGEATDDPVGHASTMIHLGKLKLYRGDHKTAEKLLVDAKDLLLRELGPKHIKYGQSLDHLSECYQIQGRWPEAEETIHASMQAYRDAKQGSVDFAMALSRLGVILAEQHRFDEAKSAQERALIVIKHGRPPGHANIATIERRLNDLCKSSQSDPNAL